MEESKIKKIIEFVKDLPIDVVYLFGSRVGQNFRPDSDYDFGVLYESHLERSVKIKAETVLRDFLSDLLGSEHVDILDVQEVYLRFKYEIVAAKRELYVKVQSSRNDFEYEVMRDYFDEMYFMKQTTSDYLSIFAQE